MSDNQAKTGISDQFWKHKPLNELNQTEWEALCDGCAKCCLIQLEDTQTGERCFTRVACQQLDIGACRCTDYENRTTIVPTCVNVTLELLETATWLPKTCAYRLIYEGKDLEWWHPLVSKDPDSIHKAGISIQSWAISESKLPNEDALHDYLEPED